MHSDADNVGVDPPEETGLLTDSEKKALAEAIKGPRAECRRIRDKVRRKDLRTGHDPNGRSAQLERVLAHVEAEFFKHSLNVTSACQAVGALHQDISGALRTYSQATLRHLIDKLRSDVAQHMLLNSRIKPVTIAHLSGFGTYSTFLRTYEKCHGETPQETRKRHGIDPYAGVPFDFGNFRLIRRVMSGDLTAEEACALQEGLNELYPEEFSAREVEPRQSEDELVMLRFDAEAFERFQTTELWPRLTELPFPEQREFVRGWDFWTPGPFKFLHQKARAEGRRNRKRGVELAQLVLDSLDGNEERLGARAHELRAEGWSWLGNAQRLELDFSAAAASFRKAEDILDTHDLRTTWVAGIFYFLKGTLRTFERRHAEALALLEQALPPFENAFDVHNQVKTLLHQAAAHLNANRFGETEAPLRKAATLLQGAPDEGLRFQITYAMISSLVRAGQFDRAEAFFASIAGQIAEIEEPLWRNQIQWTEALMDHGLGRLEPAERKYLGSWRGFQTLNEPQYAALIALDLCLFYIETDKPARVLEIAPGICGFFESIRLYDESLAAIQLFRESIAKFKVTVEILRKLRTSLWQDPLIFFNGWIGEGVREDL